MVLGRNMVLSPEGSLSNGSDADKTEDTVTLTIDGQDKKMPVSAVTALGEAFGKSSEEMVRELQKGLAGDKRMREAAAKLEEAKGLVETSKEAMALARDFEAMQQNDEGAFRRLAKKMKWDEQQIETALKMKKQAEIREAVGYTGDEDGDDAGGDGQDQLLEPNQAPEIDTKRLAYEVAQMLAPIFQENMRVGVDQLDPKLKAGLLKLVQTNVDGILDGALDTDEILGTLVKDDDEGRASEIKTMIQEEKQRRVAAGEDLTDPKRVADLFQTVKKRLSRLKVSPVKPQVPILGLGSSVSSGQSLHQEGKPLKRPAEGAASPDYDDYLLRAVNEQLMKTPATDEDDGLMELIGE